MPATNSVSPTGRIGSGPSRAIHRVALQEHAADDVVAGGAVGEVFVQQIAERRHLPRLATRAAGALPEVVVRIDDRQARVDDRFRRRLCQPVLPGGKMRPNWVLRVSTVMAFPCSTALPRTVGAPAAMVKSYPCGAAVDAVAQPSPVPSWAAGTTMRLPRLCRCSAAAHGQAIDAAC